VEFVDAELGRFRGEPVPNGSWWWTATLECSERVSSSGRTQIGVMTATPEFRVDSSFVRTVARDAEPL
jgi:hypothetical protein